MKILITGGAGFIGSNFVRFMLETYEGEEIVVLDKLTYAGRIENLTDVLYKIEFIKGCIRKPKDIGQIKDCDVIFQFAAETHVDRSIISGGVFVKTDVLGTYNLLEYARTHDVQKYIQIGTDEVYGSIKDGSFKETDILDPSSPYSASKAGADLLVKAYYKTYGLPVVITRSSNNYGPRQYPEKLIPVLILNALHDKPLPIYGDGKNIRDWIYVMDNCEAIEFVFRYGKNGEVYNVGGGNELSNIEIATTILNELDKPENLITFVKDRHGHDFRYSLDCTKINKLGWFPKYDFKRYLRDTIKWYKENKWWWKPLCR